MTTKKFKSDILNSVVILIAILFLLLGGFFLYINKFNNINNCDESINCIQNNVYAEGENYNLTFSIDDNFNSFSLNGQSVIPGTTIVLQFQSGQNINFEYSIKNGYSLKHFLCYNTDTSEIFSNVNSFGFVMPSYNLTMSISCVQVRNIKINKIIFENTNVFNTSSSFYSVDYESDLQLPITADLNYVKYELNGKNYKSKNNFNNITYEDGYLIISNILHDDEIDIYFIKKNYNCTISYFEEDSTGTGIGGSFDILATDDVFNIQNNNQEISCNVFLNSSLTILNIVTNDGYKFMRVFATDKNGHSEGLDFDIITNLEENYVIISNISTDLLIYVQFIKTFQVSLVVNDLYINGESVKIGKVGFFNETKDYNIESRLFDKNSNVTVSTLLDSAYNEKYEFKKWIITTIAGMPLDPDDYDLTEQDLMLTEMTLSNLNRNIKIEAFFGIKSFNVSVVWEGNGTVESTNVIGTNYVYPVTYGENIILNFTPKNNMFFIKVLELIKSKPSYSEYENVATKTKKDNYVEFKIENILQNLQVKVIFVKNTWWEHIETEELQGRGTEAEPYMIYTASDLAFISKNIYYNISSKGAEYVEYSNAYYLLMNDIDCGKDYYFMPLGILLDKMAQTIKHQFNGTFNYQYHTVNNMWTEEDINNYKYDGLFELLGPNANIINRYRDYKPLIFAIGGGLLILAIVIRVVFFVEKKRNKPKKVVTLSNYKNHNTSE